MVADGLQQKYPASAFVVENKPGASGNIGTDVVAKAAPDGSTLGVSIGGPLAINTLLFAKLPYDPHKDIAPVTQLVTPTERTRRQSEPWGQFRRRTRRAPEEKSLASTIFASIGIGSLSHLAMEAIAIKGGAELVHVPYASSPQAITAVIRDDAQIACLPAISVMPQAAAGAVKILAVSTARRSPYLPDVPTLKEAGIDVEADAWNGLIAPGGTPGPIIDKISRDVAEIIKQPAVREKLATTTDGTSGLFIGRAACTDGWRDRALGASNQVGECEIELSRRVLHILDVGEGNAKRPFARVVKDELIACHENFVAIKIFGAARIVGLHKILDLFPVGRGDPASQLELGLLESDLEAILFRQPHLEHVELQGTDHSDERRRSVERAEDLNDALLRHLLEALPSIFWPSSDRRA